MQTAATAAAICIALGAGWLMGQQLWLGVAASIAVVAGFVLLLSPMFGLYAIISTLILGQLVRLPAFGSEGAILPNDVIIPAFLAGWLLRGLWRQRLTIPRSPLIWPTATLAVVLAVTFVLGVSQVPFLTTDEIMKSSLYLLRWAEYALLLLVIADVVVTESQARRTIGVLAAAAVVVSLLGFVQYRLFPDFRFMVPQGWDPHIGRLLSTWFDPNFLAGFLSFILCVVAGIASLRPPHQAKILWSAVAILFAAIVLTFSRSGYAAFLAGTFVLAFLRSRRMWLLLCVVAVAVVMFVPRVQERIQGAFDLDATAKLRIVSWENAFTVIRDFPVTGIGYNTYRYVQVNYGFQEDAAEHSAGGSDSSLLTFLVTAGPAGLAAELWWLWAMSTMAWTAYRRGASRYVRGLGVGALAGLVSVVVHSFFINSLLLPHMLLTMAVVFGTIAGLSREAKPGSAA